MGRGGNSQGADGILYGKRPSLGKQDDLPTQTVKDGRSLREQIEAGDSAHNYWANCEICGAEMGVNMYGMGRCSECGHRRNPLKNA